MLITFKNTKIGQITYKVVDPMTYFLSNGTEGIEEIINSSTDEYITIEINEVNQKFKNNYNDYIKPMFNSLNNSIETFLNANTNFLEHKEEFYTEFKIPKKKPDEFGRTRYRKLINPRGDLKVLQRMIADNLTHTGVMPHNAAHAFREARDYYTNAAKHKNNKHIINLDLKDFFDSITEEILYENLKMHPIFNVDELGDKLLKNIIKVATYKGTTPQGSPLSPLLSNLIMVNFDYKLRKALNNNPIRTVYTRYADDMTFSSKKSQDITYIIHTVESILAQHYHGTIKINYSKTKKIVPGRCFITGVKLNKEHNLTVGWEKKKEIKSRIYNLLHKADLEEPTADTLKEIERVLGYLAFMNNIEHGYVDYIKRKYDVKKLHIILTTHGISLQGDKTIPDIFEFIDDLD